MDKMDKEKENILNFFYLNLDALANINDCDKLFIDSNNMIKIDEPYMFQGILRYFNNISRNDAIHVLNKLLNDIEIYFNAIYIRHMDSKNVLINKNLKFNENDKINYTAFTTIIQKLDKSIKGIENLKKTYATDIEICKELCKINAKNKSLQNHFSKMI